MTNPPASIVTIAATQGSVVPTQSANYTFSLWHSVPTTLTITGSYRNDVALEEGNLVYFADVGGGCGSPPYPDDRSGFLDANHQLTVTLAHGDYKMCVKKGDSITDLSDVVVSSMYLAPSLPPPPPLAN